MDPTFHRKPFVRALIEIVSLGITHKRTEDAETVLVAVRQLRPHLTELDTFEAWIAISRGHWHDAIRTLNNLDANTRNWSLGRALMAFCQFAVGDPAWSVSANEVIEGDWHPRRVVVLEFPSVEQARRWYESEEYREPKAIRLAAAKTNAIIVEGL